MIFSEKFYIGYRDIDSNLKIKNSAILNIFEDISGMHATQAGEGLKTSETTWLLTGYKVNIIKRPEYGDKVNVYTWGTEIKNITASREFEIKSEAGELLITGISNWVHINLKSKKIEKVTDQLIDAYQLEPEKTNFNERKLKKLKEPETYLNCIDYKIDLNWIDVNNHMNNIYYLELADMILPEEIRKSNNCSNFEIMYKKEIKYGDIIKCYYAELENTSYVVTLKNAETGEICAIIKLYLEKNNKKT